MEEIIAKKGSVVIGIGGISGSGKAQISQELADNLGATVFNIKSYSNGPVYKRDQKGRIWEDWEDPRCYDLNAFYEDIKSARETWKIVIAVGFLMYHISVITKIIDFKIMLNIPKEICQERIELKKQQGNISNGYHQHSGSSYFQHLWNSFHNNNNLFNANSPRCLEISTVSGLTDVAMQVDMFVKLGKLLQEAEPSESTEITEVIEEHPGYDVSEENQINLNRQRFTLQQRENHLEELYRKTSEIHANPKKMEDLLLEETRKRLLKSEDLLARHMQMLDSACSWIQQVWEHKGQEFPEQIFKIFQSHKVKHSPVISADKKKKKAIFIEYDDDQEDAMVDYVCNSVIPKSNNLKATFLNIDSKNIQRLSEKNLSVSNPQKMKNRSVSPQPQKVPYSVKQKGSLMYEKSSANGNETTKIKMQKARNN